MTALHLACVRGNAEIVEILLEKSEANEEAEAERNDITKRAESTKTQAPSPLAILRQPSHTVDAEQVVKDD